ncbi:MAG TPA: lysophospholipid acyltransferase family protein [Bacteroidia bacterium]|nr:lysophospholipid acyltransferase family protein [Bacteroidia bacterium]
MKEEGFLIQVFKTLFGIYAMVVVLITLVIVIPCYFFIFTFFSKEKAPFAGCKISRFWARLLFIGFFIRVDVKGQELIDPKQVYVFVCNHRSQLDIPLFAMACKGPFRFLSKIEVTRIPLVGYVVKRLYLTVDRKSRADSVASIQRMQDSLLKEKIPVLLFPEGTRNRTDKPLLDFKDGAFRLAIETQTPIGVLTMLNSGEFSPANKLLQLRPGKIKAAWSEPIITKGMTLNDIPKLKEDVKKKLLEKLNATS